MKGIFNIKNGVIAILLLFTVGVSAQQDALFSQYMFNPFSINPAYAGSRNSMSGVVLGRQQWTGIEGAPRTGSFALHSPFKGKNFALGFNAFSEKIGPSNNTGAFLTYAYHLKMGPGKLSLGLRGGFFSTASLGTLVYFNPTDIHSGDNLPTEVSPNFDFGAYYYTNKFYAGFSAAHLNSRSVSASAGSSLNSGTTSALVSELNRHYMLSTGLAMVANPNVVVKPSLLIKYVDGAPINIDVNTSVLLNKVFWIGLSYRTSKSLVMILEYNITDYARLGYAYDYAVGPLRTQLGGSHEIFLGFDLNVSRKKAVSPRYL
jgi:type IX secretion system PorP/SprF family membrane protein